MSPEIDWKSDLLIC